MIGLTATFLIASACLAGGLIETVSAIEAWRREPHDPRDTAGHAAAAGLLLSLGTAAMAAVLVTIGGFHG